MADAVFITRPAGVVDIIGWESNAAISGGVAVSLADFGIAIDNTTITALTLPEFMVSIDGLAGIATEGMALSILPSVTMSGTPGVVGTVAVAMPEMAVSIADPDLTALTLPSHAVSIAGRVGAVGSVFTGLLAPQVAITGSVQFVASAALTLIPEVTIAGVVGGGASVGLTLRGLALAASGYTGVIGSASVTLPAFAVDIAGHGQTIGQVQITLPMLVLQATGLRASASATAQTFVMHTETQALTQYDNFPFNSFAKFNGVYLGAKEDGIFALAGADDDGDIIQASARMGISDMGTSHLKRVERCYVGYRTDGDMILRVVTEDQTTRDYRMRATGQTGLHSNIVKFGRGMEARYWQFEIRNENGADFELDALEVQPTVLRRRLWSKP